MDEQNQNPTERQENTPQGDNQTSPSSSSPPPPMSGGGGSPKQSQIGSIVGIIIIIAVLVLGGLYYWGVKLNDRGLDTITGEEIENLPDEQLVDLQTQDTSNTVESIENDLNATDLEGLDAELDQIEADLIL